MRALLLLLVSASLAVEAKWPFGVVQTRWLLRLRGGEDSSSSEEQRMSEATQAVLSMVPVFALTDDKGRPVLMRSPSAPSVLPQQLFFTEVEVARAHAASIMRFSGDEKLQLRLATLNLGQVWQMRASDREIRVYADPREVHFARQLLLRAAGYVNSNETLAVGTKAVDFGNETAVANEAADLQAAIGVDLEKDVPVFTVGVLNATLGDDGKTVQPWFLSFGDLVRAYVNSTTPATDDDAEYQRQAQATLRNMLAVGETAVTTVAKLVAAMDAGSDAGDVFIMPPSSSLHVLAQAKQAQQASKAGGGASSSSPGGGGLFDDDGPSASPSGDGSGLFD